MLTIIIDQKFWCFPYSTYFLCFIKYNFIHQIINNGIVLLLPVKCFPWYGMIPVVLSRIIFSVLITKVSQDLTSIRRIYGYMNDTGFQFDCKSIYISFLALASALTCHMASLRRGGFSSIIPAATTTVEI